MFLLIEKIPENVRLFIEGAWLIVIVLLNLFLLLFGGIVFYSDKKGWRTFADSNNIRYYYLYCFSRGH